MIRRLGRFLGRFDDDERGVAAVEMALTGTLMMAALLNVVEVGRYAYLSMQVLSASQAGAHAAIVTCKPAETPVTTACPKAEAAILGAIEGTSLGANISLDGALDEGWYCMNEELALEKVGPASAAKPNCQEAGLPTGPVSLYLRVRVRAAFQPLFPGLTITESFPDILRRTAWMRLL